MIDLLKTKIERVRYFFKKKPTSKAFSARFHNQSNQAICFAVNFAVVDMFASKLTMRQKDINNNRWNNQIQ